MFNSGIKVTDLIKQINSEADIALVIPDKSYVQWLNSLQQLLYTEIIKEQKKVVLEPPFENNTIDVSKLSKSGEGNPRFEDIHAVYADYTQLIKSTVTTGVILPHTYFKIDDRLGFNTTVEKHIAIIYFVKPELINPEDIDESEVMLPIEFIDLATSKLRGEAYKLANEDALAAKWLNDYNILVETFKAWIASKAPSFGL